MPMEAGDDGEVRHRRCRALRRWSGGGRRCALAAILGTIAASAVATAVTVALRPVRLSFSITDATSWHVGATWAFNVAVANPSRRAGVSYLMLSVSMDYVTPSGRASWPLESGAPTPRYQPPRNTTCFPMVFFITKEDNLSELGRVINTSLPMIPYVKAKVRCKVGPAYTKPFEITVVCNHVYFANNETSHPHQRVRVHPPVNCTGTSP